MKAISKGFEHKIKLMEGMGLVHELVSSTMGPKGRNVVLDRGFSVPIITNDGVSVARAIEVEDDVQRMGVELIKEVALKTNEMAGDGTTTSITLAYAIVEEGMKYSENPMDIKRSLDSAKIKVVEVLKTMSKPVKSQKEILQVATLSAESEDIGRIIADTIEAIGKDGVITVEESKSQEIQSKIVDGYEVERGYVSPFMINKGGAGHEEGGSPRSEYRNVPVLVCGDKLTSIAELLPFLQKVSNGTKELVIFCPEIDPSVVNNFVFNKQTGMFHTLVVKCNSQNNEVLQDIALVTGAKFVSKEAGFKYEELDENVLGKAERVSATKDKTIIQKGKGSVKKKVQELKDSLPSIKDDNEFDLVEKRIARLGGGVAVISVGAKTESEMRYLYYKVEDAVNATKSAIDEGVVEGGGMALYRISKTLDGNTIGERILRSALHAPLRKIIENCGRDYTDIVLGMPTGKGYDAKNDVYVDMIKSGIIDPVKVERCCVENAVSFAGTFLTSHATVALIREDQKVKKGD